MLLENLVRSSADVAATPARGAKVALLAQALRELAPEEIAIGTLYLAGDLPQRQVGVGWATLRDLPPPAPAATLTIAETDRAVTAIGAPAGGGAQTARRQAVGALFARATELEQRFLSRLLLGELRQGALAGVMADAIARASETPLAAVRRALMLRGDLGAVAEAAVSGGTAALAAFGLEVGRPLQPMLAGTAADIPAALARIRPAAVDVKLDGYRVQVHRSGRDVLVFTRSLDDITARVPEVVATALALPLSAAVLDGEAIALRSDGRPEPFQVTASAVGAGRLTTLFFDVLHADGEDLLDRPGAERFAALDALVPPATRVVRVVAEDTTTAQAAFDDAVARGHEGVVVKSLDAQYEAGRRGSGWLKVKPRHTLDLVVLAAEWGHGRRRGRLSNLHLGARDGERFVMLGKTFKGLTDAMLAWQTERLLELATERGEHVVRVRPELLVEVAFDGVQASSRYPGGVTLRFARVVRHRPDKPAAEADTLATVQAIHRGEAAPR